MNSSVKKNTIYSFLKAIFSLIFPVITFPYASRILLPEGIGKVNFANSIIDYFLLIAGLGIYSYAIREGAKLRTSRSEFTNFSKEIFCINLISTLVAYLLLAISIFLSSKLANYKNLILLSSTKILFTTIGLEWVFVANEDFKYITIRSLLFQILAIFYLFIFVKDSSDIYEYCIFGLISSVASNLLNFVYSRKYISWGQKCKLYLVKHLKPLFILFGTSIAISLYTILDTTLLGFFANDKEVGIYSAANKLCHMTLSIITVINPTLLPRLSFYFDKDKNKYFLLLKKSSNYLQAISMPCVFGLAVLSKRLTLIFCGSNYTDSISSMIVLLPLIFIVTFGGFFSRQIFLPQKKDSQTLIPVICGALINLIVSVILIRRLGALGAAIGSLTAETLVTLMKYLYAKRLLKKFSIFNKFYQYLVASCIMGLSIYFIDMILPSNLLAVFVLVISGILIYSLILLLLKNEYFREIINLLKEKVRLKR